MACTRHVQVPREDGEAPRQASSVAGLVCTYSNPIRSISVMWHRGTLKMEHRKRHQVVTRMRRLRAYQFDDTRVPDLAASSPDLALSTISDGRSWRKSLAERPIPTIPSVSGSRPRVTCKKASRPADHLPRPSRILRLTLPLHYALSLCALRQPKQKTPT